MRSQTYGIVPEGVVACLKGMIRALNPNIWVSGLGFRGLGFRVSGLTFKSLGFRVSGFSFRGLGFRV